MSGTSSGNSNAVAANGTPESQAVVEEVNLLGISQITDRISALQQALNEKLPNYESILQTIHKQLAQDEALTHLLSDEQIGVICAGLGKKKNIVLVEEAKKGANGKKKLSQVTEDDI